MLDCLAATGFDPVLPVILGILLLVGGAAAAVVAFRRRQAGAAIVVALAIIALPLMLGVDAGPANAASSCAGEGGAAPDTGGGAVTPVTPACTPVTEDDVVFESVGGASYFSYNNGAGSIHIGTADSAAFGGAVQALVAAHPDAQPPVVSAQVYDPSRTFLRAVDLTLTPIDPANASFPVEEMDEIVGSDSSLIVDFDYTFIYDDGCGTPTSTSLALSTTWID